MRVDSKSMVFLASLSLLTPALMRAAVDSALVGSWTLQSSGAPMVLQIMSDGHYAVSGSLKDYGDFQAAGGKWTTTSAITKARISGSYELGAAGVLTTVGPLGPAQWKRGASSQTTNQATNQATDNPIPSGLPQMAHSALSKLQAALPDAVLVTIEVGKPGLAGHPIDFRFFSRRTGHVYQQSAGVARDLGPPNSEEQALPEGFLDLPKAIEAARSQGMRGKFGHAMLSVVHPPRGAPRPVWQIHPLVWDGELARSIDATSGQSLETARISPMPGNDRELAAAVQKVQAAIQGAQTKTGGNATGASGGLASCGETVTFVDNKDLPSVSIPAVRIRVQVYKMSGAAVLYVPTRPITAHEQSRLDLSPPITVQDYSFGKAIFADGPPDFMAAHLIQERVQQMAQAGCK